MKICCITSTYPRYEKDPIPSFIHEFNKELKRYGEVHVVVPHEEGLKEEEEIDGVFIHRFKYPGKLAYGSGMPENIRKFSSKLSAFPYILCGIMKALQVCKKYRINLIHSHWILPSGLIGRVVSITAKKPHIITTYGAEVFLTKSHYKFLKPLMQFTCRNTSVISISSYTKKHLKDLGINSRVIHLGVDTKRFKPLKMKRKGLLFVGRLVERKGVKYLLEALPRNVLLRIIGDGPERESLEEIVKQRKLNVKFLGNMPNIKLPKYFSSSEAFVLPAIIDSHGDTEGQGVVLVEAMACETPVIASAVGGIVDVVDESTGILIEQKNIKELKTAIKKVKMKARKFGKAGRKKVLKELNWPVIVKKYKKLYEGLL